MAKTDSVKELAKLLKGWNSDASDFDPAEYKLGMQIEKEHAARIEIRHAIVAAHLNEDPHYYSKLKKAGIK